jgi:hypothetical protein
MALFRGMWHLDPKYSVVSVREAKYTCLGYKTRLSRLHTLDPHLVLAFPRSGHSAHRTPSKKITKRPQISHRYLKQTCLRQDCTTQTRGETGKK